MIFRKGVTTPKDTFETAKKVTRLKLTKGIITKIDISFPIGCAGLLHVAINYGLHQVWPINSDESFAGDGETISFEEHIVVENDPFELMIYTWNLDDTYEHMCAVRIGLRREDETLPLRLYWPEEELEELFAPEI